MDSDYHGIIMNHSQKDKSIFEKLNVIGKKNVFLGLVVFYKIKVDEDALNHTIKIIQENMASKLFFKKQEYYAHFYRNDELIIVFRNKIFNVTPDKNTWLDVVEYGKSLKITEKQLDFIPNRIENETY